MGYKIDSDILFDLIYSELKMFLSPLSCLIPDDNKKRHFKIAIGGIIKKAGEMTDAEANSSEKPNDSDAISRQTTIDAVKRLSLGETDAMRLAMRIGDYLERLPSAQPDHLAYVSKKGDLISRKAVFYALECMRFESDKERQYGFSLLEQIPTAEPDNTCDGCRYERFGDRVCYQCSRFYMDRYEVKQDE